MDTLHLEIVTPEGMIFSNDVKSLTLPGSEGEFGVLPGHASIVTLLKAGAIEIVNSNSNKEIVAINWGYVKVDESSVNVLADGAVYISGNDESNIAKSIEKAKKLIKSMSSDSAALASTFARIDTAVKRSK